MTDEASYNCDSCGEDVVVPIDLTAGSHQEYVEDCPVCCCPKVIHGLCNAFEGQAFQPDLAGNQLKERVSRLVTSPPMDGSCLTRVHTRGLVR
jgi:hypothetical protein